MSKKKKKHGERTASVRFRAILSNMEQLKCLNQRKAPESLFTGN